MRTNTQLPGKQARRASQKASLAGNNRYSMMARAHTSKCTRVCLHVLFFFCFSLVVCREEEGGKRAKLHTSLSSLICERHAPVTTPHTPPPPSPPEKRSCI